MKTAISLPDVTFHRVQEAAERLGLSRSEIFARAAESYLDVLDNATLTARVDAALVRAGGTDASNHDAAAHGAARLADGDSW